MPRTRKDEAPILLDEPEMSPPPPPPPPPPRLLRDTVTTGGVCRYDPDPGRPVRWVLDAPTPGTRPSPSRRPA